MFRNCGFVKLLKFSNLHLCLLQLTNVNLHESRFAINKYLNNGSLVRRSSLVCTNSINSSTLSLMCYNSAAGGSYRMHVT